MTKNRTRTSADGVTVALRKGQRRALQAIADGNGAPLAFVVRYALIQFIREDTDGQLHLRFPSCEEIGRSLE